MHRKRFVFRRVSKIANFQTLALSYVYDCPSVNAKQTTRLPFIKSDVRDFFENKSK